MKMQNKILAPSLRQPLNWQGVLRISGLKLLKEKVANRLGVRFGSWNIESISGRETEVYEELRKRKVNVCCLQEVRWRGEGARFIGVKGRSTNCGGAEMMTKPEAWVYWLKKNSVRTWWRSEGGVTELWQLD